MTNNSKYTNKQRNIMRDIYKLKNRQRYYRKGWLEADIKIGILKKRLEESGSEEDTYM